MSRYGVISGLYLDIFTKWQISSFYNNNPSIHSFLFISTWNFQNRLKYAYEDQKLMIRICVYVYRTYGSSWKGLINSGMYIFLSVHPSRSFLGIVPLVFSETQHGVRGPYEIMVAEPDSLGKVSFPQKQPRMVKNGTKNGFFNYFEIFCLWILLKMSLNKNQHCYLSSYTNTMPGKKIFIIIYR